MQTDSGQRKTSLIRLTVISFVLVICTALAAFAQSTTEGAIGGTVADPQDRVVPNASVTATNTARNLEQSAKTNDAGYFRIGQLQPGTYTLTVSAQGFATFKVEQVIVNVGSLTPVNPKLGIGTTEKVEVSAEAPIVNTTSADFAPTLNSTAIENLPINGGRWSNFAILTPGVVSNSDGFGLLSFRGMSALLNNVTVDGADNNQAYFSEERGRTRAGYSTPKVAIEEFQVNTSNYSSEYGRSAGGVINTVTKSGSNKIHGEAFWYDRDNSWGSYNPYTTLTTVTNGVPSTVPYKPEDVRKMGAIGIGGALVKDKVFWYFAYDRYHRNFPGTAVPNSAASFFAVPDATLPAGVSCGGSGAAAPSSKDFNVCTMAALLTSPSHTATTGATGTIAKVTPAQYQTAAAQWNAAMFGAGSQLGLASIAGPTPRTGDQSIFFPRLDWVINAKNHASFEVNRMRWWSPAGIQTQATNAYGIHSFGNDYVKDTWGVAKLDTQFTTAITNQLRFQYGRDFEFENNQGPTPYEMQTLVSPVTTGTTTPTGYTNPYGLPPNIYVGSFQWGTPVFLNRVAYPDEYKWQIADTVAYMIGKHNVKFGVDFMRTNDSINNLYQQYAEYSYNGVAQYFANLYDPAHAYFTDYFQAFQGGNVSTPVNTYHFSTNDFAFFVQDDFNLTRQLTVNLGFRYETELMPSPYQNLLNTITLGGQTINAGTMPKHPNGYGPRVGFAYDVFGDANTVIRAGYGIYYGRIINSTLFNGLTNTGVTAGQTAYDFFASGSGAALANPFPQIYNTPTSPSTLPSGSLTVNYFDPNFTSPQIHEVDFTVQRDLGWKSVVSVSYLGSFGRHLQNFTDANLAAPGTAYCSRGGSGSFTSVPTAGACPAGQTLLTPPSTISYTLSNSSSGNTVGNLPLTAGSQVTVPFYTSRLSSAYKTVTDIYSGVNSSYNALAVQFEKRMSNNIQFGANYTWSHALDYGVNGTTGAASNNPVDPLNPNAYVYGNAANNVPNRFTFNAIAQSPWHANGALKYLVEGWQASPVVQIQTGLGYTVTTASATPAQYVGTQKYSGVASGMLGAGGSFQIPGTERGGYFMPNTYIVDLRLSKSVTIAERYKFEFSADGFNILNHQNVTGIATTAAYAISSPSAGVAGQSTFPTIVPNTSSSAITGAAGSQSSLFGVPTSANSNFVYNTRQIQLGVRFSF